MDIKIKTLTPVHIGNGTELQGNFEYLYFLSATSIACKSVLRFFMTGRSG